MAAAAENTPEPSPIQVTELAADLKLPEAFFEYLFDGNRPDYTLTEYEIHSTEYFGLFEDFPNWHIGFRNAIYDCFDRHHLERVFAPRNSRHVAAMHKRMHENNKVAKPTTNANYEANTESNQRAPLAPREKFKYTTREGFLKLPKFKKHSLYQKYPWLENFRRNLGYIPVYYLKYESEYIIPGMYFNPFNHGYHPNMNQNDEYGYDTFYFIFVPYGGGYGSIFSLSPNAPQGGGYLTNELLDEIMNCAAAARPAMPFTGNIARGARTMRRQPILKVLGRKGVPVAVFNQFIKPALGSEHLPSPRRRKTRKHRSS